MNYNNALSDVHIHSFFSSDSEENPINIVNTAINAGLKSICFTDHNDYDYPPENGEIMFLLDYDKYVSYMLDLKETYKNKIDIMIGVEQGLQKSVADRVNQYDSSHILDFIIGSSHLINGKDPYYEDFWNNRPTSNAVADYLESIIENIKFCNNFDVYGHLDYIIRYAPGKDSSYNWNDYSDYFDEILKSLIQKGKGIEINTAGLKYGLKETNPAYGVIKRYRELGGEIITTGSDAHKAEFLAYSFDKIPAILEACGFKYYTIFKNRKPEFIRI